MSEICILTQIRCCDGKVFAIFKKEISSFALFKGDDYEDIKAYQESKPSSSVTVQDKGFIRQLQTWLTKNLILAGWSLLFSLV